MSREKGKGRKISEQGEGRSEQETEINKRGEAVKLKQKVKKDMTAIILP